MSHDKSKRKDNVLTFGCCEKACKNYDSSIDYAKVYSSISYWKKRLELEDL